MTKLNQMQLDNVLVSFERMTFLKTLGARITLLEVGRCEITMPISPHINQQHGFVHAGAITTITDTACGLSAYSMMPLDTNVLTTEYKVNMLSPAVGDEFVAVAKVVKSGKTLTVALGEAYAVKDNKRKLVQLMTATLISVKAES